MNPATDSETLRQTVYATDEHLNIRVATHEKYSVPNTDFRQWVLDRYNWHGDERVLDLGCGPGGYAQTLYDHAPNAAYCGLDFSYGMLTRHPYPQRIAQADAQSLPFPDHSFDVVMANHMLYHVPNIQQAIVEIRRVLRPEGTLIAATNSINTMPQFYELYKRAIMVLTAPGKQATVPLPASHMFSLESGTRQLARHFFAVARYDLPGAFIFTELDPVMMYLESARSLREPQLPSGVAWDAVMLIVREQIKNQLAYMGELVIHKLSGVLIASDSGSFISSYVNHWHNGA